MQKARKRTYFGGKGKGYASTNFGFDKQSLILSLKQLYKMHLLKKKRKKKFSGILMSKYHGFKEFEGDIF